MGDDSMSGGDGHDYIYAGESSDTLDGGAGYDLLSGGAGNDTLIGSPDSGTYFGQEGADTFVVDGASPGLNWIMDFDSSDRLSIGMNLEQIQAAATQLGEHLHVALPGGGDLYSANTSLAEIEADNII